MTPEIRPMDWLGATFINSVCLDCGPLKYQEGVHKGYGDVEPFTKQELQQVYNKGLKHEQERSHRVVIYTASKT
jgi:hypothetical protein